MRTRIFPEHNYKAFFFNKKTVRMAIDPCKPILPLDFPEFYDIKITDKCHGKCPYCYMDSHSRGKHAESLIPNILKVFEPMSSNERPFQVAIGGGEPTLHPDFCEFLEVLTHLGIVPNYTTNGMFASSKKIRDKIGQYTEKFCGGVAISGHPHLEKHWKLALAFLRGFDIRTNLHIIISDQESCREFRKIYDEQWQWVDHFVLLPYSTAGRAPKKEVDWQSLLSWMPRNTTKIAFGAGFYPFLRQEGHNINVSLYEPEILSRFLDMTTGNVYKSSFDMSRPLGKLFT